MDKQWGYDEWLKFRLYEPAYCIIHAQCLDCVKNDRTLLKSMKLNLYYKLYAAFLLISILVVVLMIVIMRFYVGRSFADFIHKEALATLDNLAIELSNEYHQDKWQRFQNDPKAWHRVIRRTLPNRRVGGFRREPKIEDFPKGMPPKPPPPPVRFLHRELTLFDVDKNYVVGRPIEPTIRNYSFRAIEVDGQTVGWLGLPKRNFLSHPTVKLFLVQQTKIFILIGGGILFLAAVVAFILSRHLLAPIRRLTAGTRALAARKFDTRIQVHTQDELGQLAADFNSMAETLKNYEDSRQQWITDISHELRTPVAILKGEIEALQDGVRPLNHESMHSLKEEVNHLNKLIEDLHLLSRADAQSLNANIKPVDPSEVLQRAIGAFSHRFEGNNISVDLRLAADSGMVVQGDPDWLTRLYFNLFDNTLKYTDSPGKLVISSAFTDEHLIINFEDSGPGVPEDALPYLFDRLYRLEKSRGRSLGGSGLGLAICREIVTIHNGQIHVANSDIGGLKITVKLPIAH